MVQILRLQQCWIFFIWACKLLNFQESFLNHSQWLTLRWRLAQCPYYTYCFSGYHEERWRSLKCQKHFTNQSSPPCYSWVYKMATVNLLHTYSFIQRVHEPGYAVPKLIKSRKPFFPDTAINIHKTVTHVKYALRMRLRVHWRL